jgi:hypothetical protein
MVALAASGFLLLFRIATGSLTAETPSLREDELDRRALGLLADRHEVDDHAVELLAGRDLAQDVAIGATPACLPELRRSPSRP